MSVAFDVLHLLQRTHNPGLFPLPPVEPETDENANDSSVLRLGWRELEAALPDGGLPRGVVEITSPGALGGATRVALAAVVGGQGRGVGAWCAWVDPEGSLYAPGVFKSGVDLSRLFVVRPPRKHLAQVAVKLAQAAAFEVIVVDYAGTFGAQEASRVGRRKGGGLRPEVLVRKLALLAEKGGSTILLLTDSSEPRPLPLPVALRLELGRAPHALHVKVAKERFCRLGSATVVWPPPPSHAVG
jgi:hypothetical protein